VTLVACSSVASAQDAGPARFWLTTDYTYTDFKYKEPGVMSEHGRFAGVRGEFGINLFGGFGLSAGGEYADGHTDYDGSTFSGTPVKVITNDYLRTTQYLAHVTYGSMVIAAGMAERYWYNDLVISYRRRTRYNYMPVFFTYRTGPMYVKVEHDIWQKGWNKSHMSDVNAAANDVEFKLGKGTGFGFEVGYVIPGMLTTRLFMAYHKWDIKESDVQSDGTQNLIEPANNTTEIKAGIGLAF
jgi:hypothetical protein